MIRLERTLVIDATPEAVWAVLSNFMHVDEYAPLVKSVDALTDGEDGVGSKRRCHFENGTSVVEEVIEWEDNQSYRVQLSDMAALPFEEMIADLAVVPSEGGRTKVIWGANYRMKYGPF